VNLAWADAYLGRFLSGWDNDRDIFLLSPQGAVIRGWSKGRPIPNSAFDPLSGQARTAIRKMADNSQLNGKAAHSITLADTTWPMSRFGRPLSRWHGALVRYNGRAAIMTIVPVVPHLDLSLLRQTPNHVVAIRPIDAGLLHESLSSVDQDRLP